MDTAVALVVVIVLGTLAARLLGVRIGWRRTLFAGSVGLVTFGLIASSMEGTQTPGVLKLFSMVTGGVLAAMAAGAGVEFIAPRRRTGTLPSRTPLRAVRALLGRARRYAEVSRILVRSGLAARRRGRGGRSEPDDDRLGDVLAAALQEAGGVFIKLGQVLSTRPDLVSPQVAEHLARLQEDTERVALDDIVRVIVEDLGAHPDELFETFERVPTATASIAQVHRARLHDGRSVAVKIQRPDVADLIERDLDILDRAARRLERRAAWARELHLAETVGGLAAALEEELDFRIEARNGNALRQAIVHHERVTVPTADASMTSRRVMISEWMAGASIGRSSNLPEDAAHRAAEDLLHCMLDQLLVLGTFHADPHPGNILINDDGHCVLLDFGSVGQLDRRQMTGLQMILMAVDRQDATALREALGHVTVPQEPVDALLLERALGQVLSRHLRASTPGDTGLFTAMLSILREFRLAADPVIAGAFRAVVTLEGTLQTLTAGFDFIASSKQHAQRLLDDAARADLPEQVRDHASTLLPVLAELPRHADRLAHQLARGELTMGARLFPTKADRRFVRSLVADFTLAIIATALTTTGLLLLSRGQTEGAVTQWLGLGAVVPGVMLILRVLVAGARSRAE